MEGNAVDCSVLLRADGGPRIGMGHVMRCMALAEGMERDGYRPILVIKGQDVQAEGLVDTGSFTTEFIPSEAGLEEDGQLTLSIARKNHVEYLVTDVCHGINLQDRRILDRYLQTFRTECRTLCLTGDPALDFPADLVISPYYRKNYPAVPQGGGTKCLLGPDFFIFRHEFIRAANTRHAISEIGNRILVSIGGADKMELSVKIARGLKLIRKTDLHVRVVIGPAFPQYIEAKVRDELSESEIELDILHGCSDMAAEMLWADLALIGDGLTKYEAAVTGTPCITLSRPDSDEEMNVEFARAETSVHLGDGTQISAEKLGQEIGHICANHPMRSRMSENGQKLVDGRGIKRIIRTIHSMKSKKAG
jgi:spore coat polysaccharide biosynthesis predicted glycosyltransferase SpsG